MGIKLILVWKFPAIAKREGIKSAISINGHVFCCVEEVIEEPLMNSFYSYYKHLFD